MFVLFNLLLYLFLIFTCYLVQAIELQLTRSIFIRVPVQQLLQHVKDLSNFIYFQVLSSRLILTYQYEFFNLGFLV